MVLGQVFLLCLWRVFCSWGWEWVFVLRLGFCSQPVVFSLSISMKWQAALLPSLKKKTMQNGSVCNVNGNVFGIGSINNRGGNKMGNDK